MLETARAVLILVALPGVNSGQVEATISGSDLVISGTRMLPSELRTAVIHRLELPQGRFERRVRLPAGQYNAIPKDGPSAGVAMFLALASLMTGRTVRSDTAMTGEISLRGLVLPVGGIEEKVVAAVRAGIDRVMLPARNRKDYDDIPDEVRQSTELIWLENVDDAVVAGLGSPAAGASGAIQRQTAANA